MDRYQLLASFLGGQATPERVRHEAEWAALLELAQSEGVGPLFYKSVRAVPPVDLPARANEVLKSLYCDAVHSSLIYESLRTRLCRRLSERAISVLLLKGAALALTCYDDAADRPIGDLDLLVAPSQVEEATACLEENGFCPLSGSFQTERRSPRGHLVYRHAVTGAMVELHWELKLLGRGQSKARAEIWAGARPVGPDDPALVMRLGHTLPLLCAHMLLQHRDPRLLWLYDLHRVLLRMDAAEAVLARDVATRWQLGPCTALALLRVRELFGTPLPGELDGWAGEIAARDGLQARVAALALARDGTETPSEYLVGLLLNRNYSLRRILLPTADDLRHRLGFANDERVGLAAYTAFVMRRLRNGPLHLRQLWRFWRATPRP